MDNNLLSNSTHLALLQASQGETQRAADKLSARKLGQIETAAQEFEAVFAAEMMKPMFEGISSEAPFGGGKGEEVFRGLLTQEYGKILAKTGSIGLTAPIKEAMIKMQETADNATRTTTE